MTNQNKTPNPTVPSQEPQEQKQPHPKTAVTPSEAHDLDTFKEKLEETAQYGYYAQAERLLKSEPYAKKNRLKFLFATGYASFYHFISFCLGVGTVYLVAKMFITTDNAITLLFSTLIAIILVVILAGLELFKSSSSTDVFKSFAKEETPTNGAKYGMFGMFALSVAISAIGGGFLSLELNDKTLSIENQTQVERDSLTNLYSSQIAAYDSSINSSQKTLIRYKTGWRANVARTDLEKATAAKNEILDKLDGKLTASEKLSETRILLAESENLDLAMIVGFVVFILECFCILSYRYKFIYLRNVEREGVNFDILQKKNALNDRKNNDFDMNEITESIKDLFNNLSNSIQNQANQTFSAPNQAYSSQKVGFQTTSKHESRPNPIGFQMPSASNTTESVKTQSVKRNALEKGNRECIYCEKLYTYKVNHQKYCSKKCRMEHWEQKNGAKLKFKKE